MKAENLLAVIPLALLCACASNESDTAKTPTVYWKAPKAALPENYIAPSQILDDKILDQAKETRAKKAELDLPDLIDIALENNTSTRIYWFRAKQYAAQKGQANSAYLPTVDIGANVSRAKLRSASASYPPIGSYWQTGYGPTLELNWLLYDFGKREATSLAAKEALRAANFDYNQSVQDLVLNVNEAYFALYSAKGSVKAARASLNDAKTAYDAARAKFKEGVGTKQDMLRALANSKNAQFVLEQNIAQVESCKAKLAQVLGIEISKNLKVSDNVNIPSSPQAKEQVESLMAQSLKRRESILAAYASLRAAQAETKAEKLDYLPKISFVGSGTWTDYTDSPYTNAPNYNYAGGFALSWNIFDGFNRQYKIVGKKAAERAQAQTLKAQMLEVISSVWENYYAYKSAVKQVESSAAAVNASRESYNATKTAYENGVSSLTDLLSAQSYLATARQQHVSAKASLALAVARLAHATGTFFNESETEK